MSGARICPVEGCEKALKPGMLMCLRHWRRVPRRLRAEVFATWGDVLKALTRPVAEREDVHVAYGFARQAAIDAVNTKLRGEAA